VRGDAPRERPYATQRPLPRVTRPCRPGTGSGTRDRAAPSESQPPELKRTLRTPNLEAFDREQEGLELADEVAAEGSTDDAPEINFEDPATVERQRASYEMQPVMGPEALDSLLDELPRPTPAPQVPRVAVAPLRTPTVPPGGRRATCQARPGRRGRRRSRRRCATR